MRLLLDTHVFLWYITADHRLAPSVVQAVQNPENEVLLSVVSIWETIVKHQLGRLPLPEPPETFLPAQRESHGIGSLTLDERSVVRLSQLPLHHRDPFDRMLVCQALEHDLTIATVDEALAAYRVKRLLAV